MGQSDFFVIKWQGKELFIMSGSSSKNFKWTPDLQEAVWFEDESQAQTLCENYFKNFNSFEVRSIRMDGSLVGHLNAKE